jgi:hypothetical protein
MLTSFGLGWRTAVHQHRATERAASVQATMVVRGDQVRHTLSHDEFLSSSPILSMEEVTIMGQWEEEEGLTSGDEDMRGRTDVNVVASHTIVRLRQETP